MSKRPEGVDREDWLHERARVWRRRNRILNVLMAIAIALVLLRYCAQNA
jgi:predicted transposase YbfD/YdcC